MRFHVLALTLFLSSSALCQPLQTVFTDPDGSGPFPAAERVAGQVVLDFRQPPSPELLKTWGSLHGLTPRLLAADSELATVTVSETELPRVLSVLSDDPLIKAVSPDYVAHSDGVLGSAEPGEPAETIQPEASFPNDPLYKKQWHHAMIGAAKAWKKANGEGVTVAILDTGIAYAQKGAVKPVEDLAQTKVVEGYDFINDDPLAVDDYGFGTHLAGTVAQSTNNKVGAAGLAYAATLMPVKVLNSKGSGSYSGIAAGLRFAADHGANVIVMGFSATADSAVMEDAVEYAYDKGCVLVGSVGANGADTPGFPAAYDQVIGVGAVDRSRAATQYTSKGADITAPGGYAQQDEGVLQNALHPQNPKRSGYLWFAGTNCAAAHVGGVAALVMSTGVKDPKAVRDILLSTARKVKDKSLYGAGIVQADRAVDKALKSSDEEEATLGIGFFLGLCLLALGWLRGRRYC